MLKRTLSLALFASLGTLVACTASLDDDHPHDDVDPTTPLDTESAALAVDEAGAAAADGGAAALDLRKSFAVTDQALLTGFTFKRVVDKLTAEATTPVTSRALYTQWWDTQHTKAQGIATGPHCDDALMSGVPSFNGFPWQCPRNEGDLAQTNPFDSLGDAFVFPIGVFNRFDLAPANGANCGEYRIVFGNTRSRNLVIFEAVMPNPNPSCGIDACRPIAQFWANLSSSTLTAAQVKSRLEQLYFTGVAGFEPVVKVSHYGAAGGQIRSNQFMSGPNGQLWNLKEFKLAKTCNATTGACTLRVNPATVKTNPAPQLFSDAATDARKADFQTAFVGQVASLARSDINTFGMRLANTFNAGQSHSQSFDPGLTSPTITNDYAAVFNPSGAFAQKIQTRLTQIGSTLTPKQIVDRATTQSCGGCHQFTNGRSLGGGLTWPSSNGFVQVSETGSEAGGFGPAFPISPALKTVFLPHRRDVLTTFLKRPKVTCNPADGGAVSAPDASAETIGGGSSVH
ncbi:MAG: hypothetical protein JST00_41145 [Deltaproteobacteria bacterium]|nr:hypothetical protein [Deltaproteobacteria bacterium]